MSTADPLPRVTITYCTQCRWLLRAAVAITRATRVHPDLARGASVRGGIDLLLVVGALAELEDLDLHERDARALGALLERPGMGVRRGAERQREHRRYDYEAPAAPGIRAH